MSALSASMNLALQSEGPFPRGDVQEGAGSRNRRCAKMGGFTRRPRNQIGLPTTF